MKLKRNASCKIKLRTLLIYSRTHLIHSKLASRSTKKKWRLYLMRSASCKPLLRSSEKKGNELIDHLKRKMGR